MNQPFKTYYSSTSSGASPFLSACGAKSNMQAPENTQNYNRYAYCLNNPMKYTDPSGFTSYYVDGSVVSPTQFRLMSGSGSISAFGNHTFVDEFGFQQFLSTRNVSESNYNIYVLAYLKDVCETIEGSWTSTKSASNRTGICAGMEIGGTYFGLTSELEGLGLNENGSYGGWLKIYDGTSGSLNSVEITASYVSRTRNEKSFWEIMASDGDFGYDGANRGSITKQDVIVGTAVIATVATLGTYGELAVLGAKFGSYIIPTLSLANSIDDIGTNRNLESLSQQSTNNPTVKNILTATKIGLGALSVGSVAKDFSKMVKDYRFYGIMSGGIDGVSTSTSIYNISHH